MNQASGPLSVKRDFNSLKVPKGIHDSMESTFPAFACGIYLVNIRVVPDPPREVETELFRTQNMSIDIECISPICLKCLDREDQVFFCCDWRLRLVTTCLSPLSLLLVLDPYKPCVCVCVYWVHMNCLCQ